jgi:transcriptional regulator with XRE-family HTH domain
VYTSLAMPRVSRLNLPPVGTAEGTIGERLALSRKRRGYTQKELAKKMGLIQSLISTYEHDRLRLTAEMLIRFSNALDVGVDEILGLNQRNHHKEMRLNLKIARRIKRIESLPVSKKKSLLQIIDGFLKGEGK